MASKTGRAMCSEVLLERVLGTASASRANRFKVANFARVWVGMGALSGALPWGLGLMAPLEVVFLE